MNNTEYKILDNLNESELKRQTQRFEQKQQEIINNILEEKDKEIERLNNIIDELEKDLWKIRQLAFSKYNSNEWNNCLSFNDDILPIIKKLKELKESK